MTNSSLRIVIMSLAVAAGWAPPFGASLARAQSSQDIKISAEERAANQKRAAAELQRKKANLRQQISDERSKLESAQSALENEQSTLDSLTSSLSLVGGFLQQAQYQVTNCRSVNWGGASLNCLGHENIAEQRRLQYNEINDRRNNSINNYNSLVSRIQWLNKRIENFEREIDNLD